MQIDILRYNVIECGIPEPISSRGQSQELSINLAKAVNLSKNLDLKKVKKMFDIRYYQTWNAEERMRPY
jgi:hypothetical protein